MANLKLDLINNLNNEKYYDEIELIRLAQDPNMNYKEKLNLMSNKLKNLVLVNARLGLVEQYFKEPTAQTPTTGMPATPPTTPPITPPITPPATPVKGKVHQGQSHGE